MADSTPIRKAKIVLTQPEKTIQSDSKGYFQLDAKVDSSFKAIQNDSLWSGLMPIVTGG